jgi:glycosyltransferase involved in cell wall biosynthesis
VVEKPLVSVLLPAYNEGPLLREAIESALGQTYSRLEVIVVNDGSTTAATRDTARSFGDRITYLEQSQTGVAGARQTALEASSGELVAFLDQDDVWLPEKVETQVRALSAHPRAVLAHASCYLIDTAGAYTGRTYLTEGEWSPLPGLLVRLPATLTCIVRRDAAVAAGGFDRSLAGADDWDLWLRMALRGGTFYGTAAPLASHRRHGANTSLNIELMTRSLLGTLDKLFARDDLPESVLAARSWAYAAWHAHAAAMYYAYGTQEEAADHVMGAVVNRPEYGTVVRLVGSLTRARGTPVAPSAAGDAARFLEGVLTDGRVGRREQRRLSAAVRLGEALYGDTRWRTVAISALRAVAADPPLLLQPSAWRTAIRMLKKKRET